MSGPGAAGADTGGFRDASAIPAGGGTGGTNAVQPLWLAASWCGDPKKTADYADVADNQSGFPGIRAIRVIRGP